jgi:hypothetical protein
MNQYSVKQWILYGLVSTGLSTLIIFLGGPAFFSDLFKLLSDPGVLITDYLSVGGLFPTLFNVFFLIIFNIGLMMVMKQPLNGATLAGLFTIGGFAFFGKSIINILPIYVGVTLYAKAHETPLRNHSATLLFSSAIGPLVSYIWFALPGPFLLRFLMGSLAGILAGFLTPHLSVFAKRFHQGLNLYNIGFTLGIIATGFGLIIRLLGFDTGSQVPLSTGFDIPLWILNGILVSGLFLGALLFPKKEITYQAFLKTSEIGDDYIERYGFHLTLMNMGFLALIGFSFILVLQQPLNGPIMAGLWTLIGFGAYGKHIKNSLPLMFGVLLGIFLGIGSMEAVGTIIAIFFVTALAPVVTKYGFGIGVIAGVIHLALLPVAYQIQGGFDLYNNGFTAGFAAYLVIGLVKSLEKVKVLKLKTRG